MNFQDLDLRLNYDTGLNEIDVVKEFYVPVLETSYSYDRAAGYFSSASFASSARGVSGLVRNGGKMRLITSHALQTNDFEILQDFYSSKDYAHNLIEEFEKSFAEFGSLQEIFRRKHVAAMCWMLKMNLLEIKIVVPIEPDTQKMTFEEIDKFHPKFGVFSDEARNEIAFVGSINETASAWNRNVESFEVFRSWYGENEKERIESRKSRFNQYWTNNIGKGWKCVDLPIALREMLVEKYAPEKFPDDIDSPISKEASFSRLRSYQYEALTNWISAGRQGLLEMATGTGKTKTAKACIESAMELGPLLTIVIVPYAHIADQWNEELIDFSPYQIRSSWKLDIPKLALDVSRGWSEHLTLISVQNTASSDDFLNLIESIRNKFKNFLIVGDEVHWLGALSYQPAMNGNANFRLGLSATPKRYFDDEGSLEIRNFFGDTVYELTLGQALKIRDSLGNRILCDYEYNPIFTELTQSELDIYRELTRKINSLANSKKKEEFAQVIKDLRMKRADVIKNAENKIPTLENLIRVLPKPIKHTLVYCTNETQLQAALEILNRFDLSVQKITGDEGTTPNMNYNNVSERQYYINNFASGKLDVLLAIRCLDEGVDIPAAKTSIILASSGNEKEFIQRRGRVMRPYPDKELATIYDLCVMPEDPESAEIGIIEKEESRILSYAEDAINFDKVQVILNSRKRF